MAKGKSLHIGLNGVDPNSYAGWAGPLNACEADASDMQALAKSQGYATKTLLTSQATRDAVLLELKAASQELKAGDVFLVSYSGHGGQVPDRNNDEDDNLDETWCLYDGELIDDELFAAWSAFAPNVRIVVCSDSCHSGTVIKVAPGVAPMPRGAPGYDPSTEPRCLPEELVNRAYRAKQALYDGLQEAKPKTEDDVQANVLLISGCQDWQTSMDGPFNGAFTGALLRVWNQGHFKGTYRTFHQKIQRLLPESQQPNFMTFGSGKPFARQHPFKI